MLAPEQTGLTFSNTLTPSDSHSYLTDFFFYNGAGVGIGDIDHDGLPDIYLTGNMVSSRLYRNRGVMRFEDITEAAGVATDRWATGVAMVDVDGDGELDIYVCVSGPEWSTAEERANLLFINDGDNTFTEAASAYGIADTGFTSHAVFFDDDRDGCLDLFLLGNSPGDFGRGEAGPDYGRRSTTRRTPSPASGCATTATARLRRPSCPPWPRSHRSGASWFTTWTATAYLDLIVAGNTYDTEPNTPRADAGKGLWLRGDGRGNFRPVSPSESGFLTPLDVRDLALIDTPAGKVVLVANNGGPLQAFTLTP